MDAEATFQLFQKVKVKNEHYFSYLLALFTWIFNLDTIIYCKDLIENIFERINQTKNV